MEASFLRKSSLEVCEVYVNLINFRLDIWQEIILHDKKLKELKITVENEK